MPGVNKFAGEGQTRNHHVFPYYRTMSEEKISPNEEIKNGTNLLDDMDNNKFTEKLTIQCVMIQ